MEDVKHDKYYEIYHIKQTNKKTRKYQFEKTLDDASPLVFFNFWAQNFLQKAKTLFRNWK